MIKLIIVNIGVQNTCRIHVHDTVQGSGIMRVLAGIQLPVQQS